MHREKFEWFTLKIQLTFKINPKNYKITCCSKFIANVKIQGKLKEINPRAKINGKCAKSVRKKR